MQLRAYLGPSETFITGVAAGEKPVVECTIRNFGQTPAHRVSYWADCRVLNSMSDSFDRGPPRAASAPSIPAATASPSSRDCLSRSPRKR